MIVHISDARHVHNRICKLCGCAACLVLFDFKLSSRQRLHAHHHCALPCSAQRHHADTQLSATARLSAAKSTAHFRAAPGCSPASPSHSKYCCVGTAAAFNLPFKCFACSLAPHTECPVLPANVLPQSINQQAAAWFVRLLTTVSAAHLIAAVPAAAATAEQLRASSMCTG